MSVESVHNIGNDLTAHATNLSEACVSHVLRNPEMFSNKFAPLEDWAANCSKVRQQIDVVKIVQLEKHPLVVQRMDEAMAKGVPPHRALSHRDIREVWYRADAVSMHNQLGSLKQAIEDQYEHVRAQLNAVKADPLRLAIQSDDIDGKLVAMKSRYVMALLSCVLLIFVQDLLFVFVFRCMLRQTSTTH